MLIKMSLLCVLSGVAGIVGGATYMRSVDRYTGSPSAIAAEPVAIRTIRTKSWFLEHQNDLQVKLAACSDNPGAGASDPECENALAASEKISLDQLIAKVSK